jgi:hypothetical protein
MSVSVPDYVQEAAKRGLEWHAEGKSGDGVTEQTIREARDMASGEVSEDKVRRMGPWFQRHRPDMDAPKNKPGNEDFPGAGAVAWALWGGPTSGDIMRTAKWAEDEASRLDSEDEDDDEDTDAKASQPELLRNKYMALTIEERFKAAEAAVISLTAERDDLRKSVEAAAVSISAELDQAKVELAAKDSSIAELAAKLEEANAKVAALEASAQSGAKEAASILASSGVEPVKAQSTAAAAAVSLADQYAAMPAGPERRAFFKKHKAVLFSAK